LERKSWRERMKRGKMSVGHKESSRGNEGEGEGEGKKKGKRLAFV